MKNKFKILTINGGHQVAVDDTLSGNLYVTDGFTVEKRECVEGEWVIIASKFPYRIHKSIPMWRDEVETICPWINEDHRRYWIHGYKANTKQYTEEQLREAFVEGHARFTDCNESELEEKLDKYLQSLQPQTIEFKMEEIEYGHVDDYSKPHGFKKRIKTTTDSEGQLWCNVKEIK